MAGRDALGRKLYGGVLTNSLATVYTAPTNKAVQLWSIVACNTGAGSGNLTLVIGGTYIFDALPMAASETLFVSDLIVMAGDETIQAFFSTADVLNMRISGSEA